jgi:hypothetical protein
MANVPPLIMLQEPFLTNLPFRLGLSSDWFIKEARCFVTPGRLLRCIH